MKSELHTIAPFDAPGAVLAYLRRTPGELDAKDAILGELVAAVQRHQHRELATALLWLGLWPGLDAIYNRRLHHFPHNPEELVSLLAAAFTELVEGLDLSAVRRVAATLVRSTERELMASRRRAWDEEERRASDVERERYFREMAVAEYTLANRVEATLGRRPGRDADDHASTVGAWLRPVLGDDTGLLLSVLIVEESQREAGMRLGLSHEAARKRFRRAVGALRQHLAEPVSQSGSVRRVCPTSGRSGRPGGADR